MHTGGITDKRMQQLELLSAACHRHREARVVELHAARPRILRSHLIALRADALLMAWPRDNAARDMLLNTDVDILFELNGQPFACQTSTRGQILVGLTGFGVSPAWRMALPRRIERRDERQYTRVDLRGGGLVPAVLTDMDEPRRRHTAEVVSLSAGGLRVQLDAAHADQIHVGQALRIELSLPTAGQPTHLIARVVHVAMESETAGVELGCRFLPCEDPAANGAVATALETFVRARLEADTRRLRGQTPGGQ